MYKISKKICAICSATLLLSLLAMTGYVYLEPEMVVAASQSDNVIITLNVDAGITISNALDTYMSTSLGVSSHTAVATSTWNVKTNASTGYTLAIRASTDPAMKSGSNVISNYATSSVTLWSVASGNAAFGASAFGTDVPTATWGTGTSCNGAATSTINTTLKYRGITTTDYTVATRSSTTTPSGVDTVVCYAVEQDGMYVASGTYTATITATATTL